MSHFKIDRRLLQHPLWLRERFTPGQAWVDLIGKAEYRDTEVFRGGNWIPVKRGCVFTSQAALAARWRWDRETVRRFLASLESAGMCHIRTSKQTESGYTLIEVVNYDIYQGDGRWATKADAPSDAPSEFENAPSKRPSDAPSEPASFHEGKPEEVPHPMPHPNPHPNQHPCHTPKEPKKGGERADVPSGQSPSHRAKGNGKAPEGYQVAVDWWFAEYERTRGGRPQFGSAEGDNLKRLLGAHPPAHVKALMTFMLTRTRLKHIRERHAYTIHSLIGSWNELWDEARGRAAAEGEVFP